MASNDQILAALAPIGERIAELNVKVSAIPEISERTDEVHRAIKGHNGTPGLMTKVLLQESVLQRHLEDYACLQDQMRKGFSEIKSLFEDHAKSDSEKAEQELKENREERRDEQKDTRKFRFDLALILAAFLLDIVLRLTNVY